MCARDCALTRGEGPFLGLQFLESFQTSRPAPVPGSLQCIIERYAYLQWSGGGFGIGFIWAQCDAATLWRSPDYRGHYDVPAPLSAASVEHGAAVMRARAPLGCS